MPEIYVFAIWIAIAGVAVITALAGIASTKRRLYDVAPVANREDSRVAVS